MSTPIETIITSDHVIQAVKKFDSRVFNFAPNLEGSEVLQKVIHEFIKFFAHIEQLSKLSPGEYEQQRVAASQKLTYPAWSHNPLQWLDIQIASVPNRNHYILDSAISCTQSLIRHIEMLEGRVSHQPQLGVSWDRKWESIHDEYHKKKARLVECLREAADIFDTGQCDSGVYPSLTSYRKLDEKVWCGADQLREWANTVEFSPVEVVFPVARPDLPGYSVPFDQIGKSGGAANPESALRAMVVREVYARVPGNIKNRYSTIASLVEYTGLKVSRNYVRSLLLRGVT